MSVALLREMFERLVVAKNAELIERCYDPDFMTYSDGLMQNFTEFRDSHREIYETPISYAIEYDEQAWVERRGRIHRIWETTWPSWRNVAALESY